MSGGWTQEAIGGKTADVYDPPGPGQPRFGVLYLHGHGLETLVNKPAWTRLLEELHLACVCPHGQRSWWADRVCAEFDPAVTPERYLLDSAIPFFESRWGIRPGAIGLAGVSMGGQGVLRLAFKHADTFPAVAAVSSAIDHHEVYGQGTALDEMYDSKEQCRQDTATLHINPHRYPPHVFFCIDPDDTKWVRGNDRLHEKLNALGVAHTLDLTTRAGGHTWDYFSAAADRALRFLHAGLELESRRLIELAVRMRVALMITCLGDVFFPDAGVATVKLLRRLGVEVGFPAAQTCCGQPQFNSGYHDDARALARHTIQAFAHAGTVVTPSGSCAAMVRLEYPELLKQDLVWHGRAEDLAHRTYELSDFLVNVLGVEDVGARFEARATYHMACHLRGLGVLSEPERLLRKVKGLELLPLERFDECCGFGGSFSVRFPGISGAMVSDKAGFIEKSGAEVVIATDAGCLMNIGGCLHRRGGRARAMHLAEVLATT